MWWQSLRLSAARRMLERRSRWPGSRLLLIATLGFALSGCEALRGPEFAPTESMVAIEVPTVGDSGASPGASPGAQTRALARVGPVTFSGTEPIRLHAVLVGREGETTVYYTSATRLEIDGEEVAAEMMRPWPNRPMRCLWQTLEVSAPLLEVDSTERLESLEFTNFSHPDWGVACSAIATITARQRDTVLTAEDRRQLSFGAQNYQVWVEFLETETSLVSEQSIRSPGSEALLAKPQSFPRVRLELSGRLETAAAVFGLSQIEPKPGLEDSGRQRIIELHRSRLLFSREPLFQDLVAEGPEEQLNWRLIELDGTQPFLTEEQVTEGATGGVRIGDLLRVGARFVVVFRDLGISGALDGEDLCFDYSRGAIVRRLADVFVGDGDGDVEWAAR